MVQYFPKVSYFEKYDSKNNSDVIRRYRNRQELQIHIDELSKFAARIGLVIDNLTFRKAPLELDMSKGSQNDKNKAQFKAKSYFQLQVEDIFNKTTFSRNEIAFKSQKVRDICNISEEKYYLFKNTMGFDNYTMSTKPQYLNIKKSIDSFFPIENANFGKSWILKDPFEKIKYAIKDYYVRNNKNIEGEKVRIKFAMDGTQLTSKNMKILNHVFTIINDKCNAMSVNGNFSLGVHEIDKEDYDTVKSSISNILPKLKEISEIEIDGVLYPIEQYNAGDMKSLLLIYGINAANSGQPCIHCTWNKNKRIDYEEIYQERNINQGMIQSKNKNNNNGYLNEPITYIEHDRTVPDMLHLVIRISEKLIDALETQIEIYEGGFEEAKVDLSNRKEFSKWINFLTKDCKITNPYYSHEDFETKKITWKRRGNITGSEFDRIFEKLLPFKKKNETDENFQNRESLRKNIFDSNYDGCLRLHAENLKNVNALKRFEKLFLGFWTCIYLIKNYKGNDNNHLDSLKARLKDWVKLYENILNPTLEGVSSEIILSMKNIFNQRNNKIKKDELIRILKDKQINMLKGSNLDHEKFGLTFDQNQRTMLYDLIIGYKPITPYMHELYYEIPRLLEKYQDVNIFNIQGLEKLNHFTTEYFYKCTNRKLAKKEYLLQLMNKINRIDFYKLNLGLANLKFD